MVLTHELLLVQLTSYTGMSNNYVSLSLTLSFNEPHILHDFSPPPPPSLQLTLMVW